MVAPLFRYATDASGSKEMAVNAASPYQYFYIEPRAGEKHLEIPHMVVFIRDTGSFDSGKYGNAIVLTNGVSLEVVDANNNVVTDILDGVTLLTNSCWARICDDLQLISFGSGDAVMRVSILFTEVFGSGLYVDQNHRLRIGIRDDLSGLSEHKIMVHGAIHE